MLGRVSLGGTGIKQQIKCLAQEYKTVIRPALRLKPAALQSPV